MKKLRNFTILDGIVMATSWVLMLTIDYISMYDDKYSGLSSVFDWYTGFRIIFLISAAILGLLLFAIIIKNINMKRLRIFAILDGIIMAISGIIAYVLNYISMHDDNQGLLGSGLGWYALLFLLIFFLLAGLLALALSIIIIHKIIQNIQKFKIFAVLDGIVMVVSWVLIYILDYIGVYSKDLFVGLSLSIGWIFVLWIIFLLTLILLVLALIIIIMHKIINKIIHKIKK